MSDANTQFVVRLTTHPAMVWWIKHVVSRIDPILHRATNGRLTFFGPPAMPMVTLETVGRETGKIRPIHLAAIEHQGDHLVVASAMGQQKHPAWRYNLEAHPEIDIQMTGERFRAEARVLTDEEKAAVWDKICKIIPQIRVYETRTDRNIRVFRLRRLDAATAGAAK